MNVLKNTTNKKGVALREALATAEQRPVNCGTGFCSCIECLCEPAQPEQEPVAWNWMQEGIPFGPAYYGNPPDADIQEVSLRNGKTVRLLYTAPPQRQPLPAHELVTMYDESPTCDADMIEFARAVEAAHGIGGQP